jgi:hypothetical protein
MAYLILMNNNELKECLVGCAVRLLTSPLYIIQEELAHLYLFFDN